MKVGRGYTPEDIRLKNTKVNENSMPRIPEHEEYSMDFNNNLFKLQSKKSLFNYSVSC